MNEINPHREAPTPERLAKGDVKTTRAWLNNRQYAVLSAAEEPLVLDALHHRGILSDRLYRAGETLRGIWRAIGQESLTFKYIEKVAGPRELSERQTTFWSLYNDCCRAIPHQYRLAVLAVCCEDEIRSIAQIQQGLHALDNYLARLYRDREQRLGLYLDYLTKGL